MAYWATQGYDIDDILDWSFHKRNFYFATFLHNREQKDIDIQWLSPKLEPPKLDNNNLEDTDGWCTILNPEDLQSIGGEIDG